MNGPKASPLPFFGKWIAAARYPLINLPSNGGINPPAACLAHKANGDVHFTTGAKHAISEHRNDEEAV